MTQTKGEETPSLSEAVKDREYEIADYTGLTRKQAKDKTKKLRRAGLKLRYETKYSKKAKGTVISQTLKAGSTYENVREVSLVLVVSKGQKPSPTAAPTGAPRNRPTASSRKPKKPEMDFSGNLDEIPGG